MTIRLTSLAALCALIPATLLAPASAHAQGSPGTAPAAPAIDFSGLIFGNYSVRTDSAARAATGGKNPNQFTIDRVYLTFRMPAGDRASIRATTDIFQNASDGYYGGWTVRLKYGYLQYEALRDIAGKPGFNLLGRIGMLHTVTIDHVEQFWPRYITNTAVERFGFFPSSDLGVAAQLSLPGRWGELYGTVTNGPGYTAPENDRFKDVALRATITPFAKHDGFLKTFAISPWIYDGKTKSRFANGGAGQLAPITDPLRRDRWGIFAGVRDPRLTLGAHYAQRTESYEYGGNTAAAPRIVSDTSGTLVSAFAVARPFAWKSGTNTSRLGAVLRFDRFKPRNALAGTQQFVVAGLQFEPTTRTALALDFQQMTPRDFAGAAPIVATRTWYLHWSASF